MSQYEVIYGYLSEKSTDELLELFVGAQEVLKARGKPQHSWNTENPGALLLVLTQIILDIAVPLPPPE